MNKLFKRLGLHTYLIDILMWFVMSLLKVVSRLYVSRKKITEFSLAAFFMGIVLGALLLNLGRIPTAAPGVYPQFTLMVSGKYGGNAFSSNSSEVMINIDALQYDLPVDLERVQGYDQLKSWLGITQEQADFLSQNGFVVSRVNRFETLSEFYTDAQLNAIPILVTTDAVLNAYHVLFDETLKRVEMNELIDEINVTTSALLRKAQEEAEALADTTLGEASKLNVMYLEVAHALMQSSFVPTTAEAALELQLISEHNTITFSPIFGYKEDYSQYVPRGHYTENEQLKAYFKTMMWLGRMRFALLTNGVINVEQTRAAVLFTGIVANDTNVYNSWMRMYQVSMFFVGFSDDLTFADYLDVLSEKGITSAAQICDDKVVVSIAQELLQRNRAKILGTFAVTYRPQDQEHELQRILNETAGLRFMGQRFIPDSYIFQQLVFTQVGNWSLPRLFPKSLDVPAVLGSDLARSILYETEMVYENYTLQLKNLRDEFKTLSVENWTRNLYWSWLYTANSTLDKTTSTAKYPTFMTRPQWGYEKLQTFTGTWTELRHDTILYAKQSYTPWYGMPPPFSGVYVEPYPETYYRLIGLINMTMNGLTTFEILPTDVKTSLASFMEISELFLNASAIELEGKTLNTEMQEQIGDAAKQLSRILSVASEKTQRVMIVADVHTDPNTESVLEEALGKFNVLIILHAEADGALYASAGPVYNYFEFTQPLNNRLTDETWLAMLTNNPPEPPKWTDTFAR